MSRRPPPAPRRPVATYRLQLRGGVDFRRARRLLPYLERLGVSDLYPSPPFAAEEGSAHGYDVVDPTRMDPALGGRRGFETLGRELRERGMGLLLDIVPNHMAASPGNPWWQDVLRRGRGSPFARFFDIDWTAPGAHGKVLLPVLERPVRDLLSEGAFTVETEGPQPVLVCGGLRLPLSPVSERAVRERGLGWWRRDRAAPSRVAAFRELLAVQHYRLLRWRDGNRRVNYRRFFDVSALVALREEDPRVFDRVHAAIGRLVREGTVTALRVDHLDGLWDPAAYLYRLRAKSRIPFLAVEKILEREESLPRAWPADGATGYGILNDLGDLFVDAEGWRELEEVWGGLRGAPPLAFDEVRVASRRRVLEELFGAEVGALVRRLERLGRAAGEPLGADELRDALVEVTSALDVYRTYVDAHGVPEQDRRRIEAAVRRSRRKIPEGSRPGLRFLRRVLLLDVPAGAPAQTRAAWIRFVARWQQLSGPAAAKGVEDTALYRDVRLLSRNEVGGDPGAEPISVAAFHRRIGERREGLAPLISTSTHDTKRSEDVRARIAVLSEMPDAWRTHAARWMRANRRLRSLAGGRTVPDADEELYLYQTLLGAWPLEGDLDAFAGRIREHVVKAAREAKVHTDWLDPDLEHEAALASFAAAAIGNERFLRHFLPLQRTVAFHGAMNSLGQVVLRSALPGVPDVYNGAETWNLSLVDPDNRRPVDFAKLARMLAWLDRLERRNRAGTARELLDAWPDGRVKLYVVSRSLRLRLDVPELFLDGRYLPVAAHGSRAGHVVAFARRLEDRWALAVAPRLTLRLAGPGRPPLGERVWADTTLELPREAPPVWRDVFTGGPVRANGRGGLLVADVLARFPVALLVSVDRAARYAPTSSP
ncbi:MAG TPA: malto-oligosyltrehalose synthase [Actinomycetota bacterium]